MSKTVDSRVVEMQFDNKLFERNVANSVDSINKLNQTLNKADGVKGLENLGKAANKVDMSGIGAAVETVQAKFSTLQVMAVTALANITNSAVNAGKRIASALTIQPITTGFNEYETKIGAIQTIMSNTASKGTTMDQVTKTLDELNLYADKTIYNFAEMTRNIGTFTAAGVGLEDSASAIQGIANLAAASGSTSQQASTAMYQLSQALATGSVKLMDWNSVVNAGMGGQLFQEALKETAREQGIAVDSMIKKHGSFRESLTEGWISADVLNETLKKFTVDGAKKYAESMVKSGKYTKEQADALIKEAQSMEDAATKVKTFTQLWDTLKESAQSGWSQTWEIIIGDFEEAKETLTKFSDVIGGMLTASANARNEVLQGWKDAGGRSDLIDSLYNAFEGIMSIIKPIKEAFRDIFPPITVQQLVGLTKGLKELTAKFKIGSETANKLKRTFKGVFAVLDIGVQIIKGLFGGFITLLKHIAPAGNSLLDFTASVGDGLVKIDEFIKKGNVFSRLFNKIAEIIGGAVNVIKDFVLSIVDLVKGLGAINSGGMTKFAENVKDRFKPLTATVNAFSKIFEGLGKIVKAVFKVISGVVSLIVKVIGGLADRISTAIGDMNFDEAFDTFNQGIFSVILIGIARFVNKLSKLFKGGSWDGIKESLANIKDAVCDTFEGIQEKLKSEVLKNIAIAIAILAASLFVISTIDPDRLADSLLAVGALLGELILAMRFFSKNKDSIKTGPIIRLAAAMVILSTAMKIMSTMDPEEMAVALFSMATGLIALIGAVRLLPNEAKVSNAAKALKKLATSMVILAVALKIMASMTWEEMGRGLLGMAVGLGVLVGAIRILPTRDLTKSAKAIKKLSTSLVILALAMKIMATMSWEEIGKALLATAVGLGVLVGAVKILPKDIGVKALSLIALSTALVILGGALKIMATMSWDEVGRGLLALAGSLLAIALAMKLMPKDLLLTATGLAIVSGALVVLASALKIMASMSWEEMGRGLLTLTATLTILAVAMKAIQKAFLGGIALAAIAASLILLAIPLKMFAAMSLKEIGLSLIALAGALTIVGVAAKFIAPLAGSMLKLAGAMLVFAIAAALFSVAVVAISGALLALGTGAQAIVSAILNIIEGVLNLIPTLFQKIAEGIVAFCGVITDGIPAIGEAIRAIVTTIIQILVECVPEIVGGVLYTVAEILKALAEYAPTIVEHLFKFLIAVIDSLARHIPDLIKSIVNLLMAIFQGTLDALGDIDINVLMQGIGAVGVLTGLMAALGAVSGLIPFAMVGAIGLGLVIAELALVLAAVGALASIPGLTWLVGEGASLMYAIGNSIGSLIGGIIGGIANGITSSLPNIATDLSTFMINLMPFIEGAKYLDPSMLDGVAALTGIILALTAANVLEGLTSWATGGSSIAKFAEEIPLLGEGLAGFSNAVKGADPNTIAMAATAAKALAEMTRVIPNEGGVASWFAGENSISKFGTDIIELGKGLKGFSDHVAGANPEVILAAANAAKALAEMTRVIPNEGGVASWFAGENSISKFGADIVELGKGLKGFSDSALGVNPEVVIAAANAAKVLAEMTSCIPNEGGVVSWFAGENSISKFGADIVELGKGLKGFSDNVAGVSPEVVIAASNAAKVLAEMTSCIPNEGGVVSWFAGENSISKFGADIIELGKGLKGFSDNVVGIDPAVIIAATAAAKTLAEMTNSIPNSGGVVSWFAGDNSIAKFGTEIVELGKGIKGFSDNVIGVDPIVVVAAANAAKALAEMTNCIPNSGGMVSWFTGDNSIAKFGSEIAMLGLGIKGFSDNVIGIDYAAVTVAANAAKSLAQMTSYIPNEGGVASWFTGESGLAKFGTEIANVGKGIKGFSDNVIGIDNEAVTVGANAAKALAEMTAYIPKEGGIAAWFTGESAIAKFGTEIGEVGKGIKAFSENAAGIDTETVTAGANAAKSLAEITKHVPNEGGVTAWFTGESGLAKFSTEIANLGTGIKDFATNLGDTDPEVVIAGANAAKSLAEMTKHIPNEGGMQAWFSGESGVVKFAGNLPKLGEGLKNFADKLDGIKSDTLSAGANAAKTLAEMTETVPGDTSKLISFGTNLVTFGGNMKSYYNELSGVTLKTITQVTKAVSSVNSSVKGFNAASFNITSVSINHLVKAVQNLTKIKESTVASFKKAITSLAKTNVSALINEFKKAGPKIENAGESVVKNLVKGLKKDAKTIKSTFKDILTKCLNAIKEYVTKFNSAGKNLVKGFAKGISENSYLAKAKAKAMAKAAADAAKEELDINSPSKVGEEIGGFFGIGFVNKIGEYVSKAYNAGSEMAGAARSGLSDAISRVADSINSDMDMQPTIRPVIDLSNVKSGVGAINSMLGFGSSVGVLSNVRGISSAMNNRIQNGSNSDVISALEKLGRKLDNRPGDTYNVNGVSYDDGSNVADAVKTIVRAARIVRRA